jgi:putative transposase
MKLGKDTKKKQNHFPVFHFPASSSALIFQTHGYADNILTIGRRRVSYFPMPRASRTSPGGMCYHVLNRGNLGSEIFLKDGDYEEFVKAMRHACVEIPMRVLAYCLMPNHYHLVVWPAADGDLSRWMHWLQNTHVRRYHQRHGSSGHVWQGRFKAFPIEENKHLLTVLRYAERNPVRAKLTRRAENWKWSSARDWKASGSPDFLVTGPVRRPKDWLQWTNQALTAAELESLRRSVNRGTPFGSERWVAKVAEEMGLQSTLRPRGRPRKTASEPGQS